MRLRDQVCLITGGGSGIGEAIARRFAQEGAIVEIGDQDQGPAETVAREIRQAGLRAEARGIDVRDEDAAEQWASSVMRQHGRIDVLVNNAGISAVGELHNVSRELWDAVLAVNVTGVFLVSRAVLPYMMKQQAGSVVNMSSCIAEMGLAKRAAYAATKGAVLAMTKSMQVDYAPFHIRINAIMPGTILTPFVERYLQKDYKDPEAALASLRQRQLAADLGRPEDVASAALFLASDESRYVMGTGFTIDGGTNAGKPY